MVDQHWDATTTKADNSKDFMVFLFWCTAIKLCRGYDGSGGECTAIGFASVVEWLLIQRYEQRRIARCEPSLFQIGKERRSIIFCGTRDGFDHGTRFYGVFYGMMTSKDTRFGGFGRELDPMAHLSMESDIALQV